mmetsp:Transcript_122729/g.261916  ORF Transcript_122729/g.261916 Transcript_122729/m.261916 type:complete len:438 (-) Transcript_122729:129-1442(-)
MAPDRQSRLLAKLPDECWLRVFTYLEAAELSGAASSLCAGAQALSNQPQLWVALLYIDFCASFAQRALLRTWLVMHQHFHPRQLYIHKRREHVLDLDIARAELQQRGEQAREQDRKQRRLRTLNFVLVRVTHLLLCMGLLTSSVLLWLRMDGVVDWAYYVVFGPFFVFEAFLLASAAVAYTIYFLRGSSGWTFYWNRLRGAIRWLILYSSPWEGLCVLLFACSIVPLLACYLEGDTPLPTSWPQFLLPFSAFWLTALCFVCSWIRRRAVSATCVGSFVLLWLPIVSLSVLLFLRLSVLPQIPAYAVFAPSLTVTSLLLIFVGFLVVASFWLGYRGNRDWTEYATITLLTMLTVLLPILVFQFAILGYICGVVSTNLVFLPWVLWLSGLLLCATWHIFTPLAGAPSAPMDHLTRPWRNQQDRDSQSDTELLLPPVGVM